MHSTTYKVDTQEGSHSHNELATIILFNVSASLFQALVSWVWIHNKGSHMIIMVQYQGEKDIILKCICVQTKLTFSFN